MVSSLATASASESKVVEGQEQETSEQDQNNANIHVREAGVSDAVWQQLQHDRAAQEHTNLARETEIAVRQANLHSTMQEEHNLTEQLTQLEADLEWITDDDDDEASGMKRRHEEARRE